MILLDTHVVIWLTVQPELLSADARNAIRQARVSREPLACSPVSLYEAAYAERRGRLPLIENIHIFLGAVRSILEMAPLTPEIVIRGMAIDEENMIAEARQIVQRTLDSSGAEEKADYGVIKEKIRNDLKKYIQKSISRRPLIMPVILEI